MFEDPEKKFQRHIADYFIREYRYALLGRDRFPEDIMFQLTSEEKMEVVANCDRLWRM